jgi:O-antigen/teichoic acid export membrane protein
MREEVNHFFRDRLNVRNKIIRDTFFLNAASLFKQGLAVLQSLIVMRFLEPEAYGLWLGLNILLVYSSYIHFGLEHGMGNLIPYYQGLENIPRVLQIQDTVYLAWTVLAGIGVLGVGVYAFLASQTPNLLRWGLVIVACMIFLEQQIAFRTRWLTNARKEFRIYSSLTAFRGITSFCVIVPLAYLYNVKGVMVGALVVSGISLIAWIVRTPYRYGRNISADALRETLRFGFPILLVVLGGVLIETVDRMMILAWLGPLSLGYYGLTAFGGNSLYGVLAQAGSAMSPHVVEAMGRPQNSARALEKFLVKPTILFSGLISILIMGLVFAMPLLIQLLIPGYTPGLMAFYLFVPGFFFLSIILSANTILNIHLIKQRRQRVAVLVQIAAISIEVLAGILFTRLGWGIAGIALASTLAYATYGLAILILTTRVVIENPYDQRRFMMNTMSPFLYGLFMTLVILMSGNRLFPENLILRTIVEFALYGFAVFPLAFWLEKHIGFVNDLKSWLVSVRYSLTD